MPARKKKTTKSRKKVSSRRRTAKKKKAPVLPELPTRLGPDLEDLEGSVTRLFTDLTGEITSGALRLAARTGGVPLQVAKALLPGATIDPLDPERLEMMKETGHYLKDVRELTGLTISELSDALKLGDRTVLEAVENGTATLSFELILRLAALLARHDPIPFIIRFTRTYNPEIWSILEDWGIGRLPVQYEREREFINVFRRQDDARLLSDDGFVRVLDFTRAAFDMSLHFASEHEGLSKRKGRRAKKKR